MSDVVDWNPTGEEWIRADLLEQDDSRAVIRLWENDQTITAERRHLRAVPGRCEGDLWCRGTGKWGVCLAPLDRDGRCTRPGGHGGPGAVRGDTP